jgi:hypothetical protein
MTRLTLRAVERNGTIGDLLGSAELDSRTIIYDGSTIVPKIVRSVATRWAMSEREAFDAIVREGWSNGRLRLAEETGDEKASGGADDGD